MSKSKEKENLELQVDGAEHRLNLLHQKLGADGNNPMKLVKEHESQIQRKEKSFKYAKELNQQLIENMSKVEAILAELRCHNKDLLAPLESRLNDTQHDVSNPYFFLSFFLFQKMWLTQAFEVESLRLSQLFL